MGTNFQPLAWTILNKSWRPIRRPKHQDGSEPSHHHVGIDEVKPGVPEGGREPADDGKAEVLPQPDGPFVGSDDEVELHGCEATGARLIERMRAHGPGHAAPKCVWRDYVTAIGHMRAAASIIGAQIIRANDRALILGGENRMSG
jgi:hypothetical protein